MAWMMQTGGEQKSKRMDAKMPTWVEIRGSSFFWLRLIHGICSIHNPRPVPSTSMHRKANPNALFPHINEPPRTKPAAFLITNPPHPPTRPRPRPLPPSSPNTCPHPQLPSTPNSPSSLHPISPHPNTTLRPPTLSTMLPTAIHCSRNPGTASPFAIPRLGHPVSSAMAVSLTRFGQRVDRWDSSEET